MKQSKAKSSVIYKELPEGALLFSVEDELYLGLNPVGARVWQLLPPVCRSVDEIVEHLAREYPEVSPDLIREDVVELLLDFEKNGLLEPLEAA